MGKFRVRVWCEDREHESFVRALFESFGFERRDLVVNVSPRGLGSAFSWVIQNYPRVRAEARATINQANLGFLLVVDGDNAGVNGRLQALDPTPNAGRAEGDRIAILVPTWSIETWTIWLQGTDIDETAPRKAALDTKKFRESLATAIAAWDPSRADEAEKVPSLTAARRELARLPRP